MLDMSHMRGDSIHSRSVSGFALSVGTGLCFESLFLPTQPVIDPERTPPDHINLINYQECWINITTLFRNICSAMSPEAIGKTLPSEFKEVILMEMDVINSLFQHEGNGFCKPIYYFTTHDKLKTSTPPQIKYREDKTDKQKTLSLKLNDTLKELEKESDQIRRFKEDLNPATRLNALILTHIPYDLLSYSNFNKLSLLESHTGKKKERNQWYTKYFSVGEEDLSHLPFNRKLLLVFGDKILITPSIYKLRLQILEALKKNQITAMSTESRVMQVLSYEIKEPYVVAFLKSL